MPSKVQVNYAGNQFASFTELGQHLGMACGTLIKRLKQGTPLDKPINNGTVITFKGRTYSSFSALAAYYGISSSLLSRRLGLGWSLEKALNTATVANKKEICIRGRVFSSIRVASRHYNMKHQTLAHRIRRGWNLEEAVGLTNYKEKDACTAGIVYLIWNDINDKKYIGITTRPMEERWASHLMQASKTKNRKFSRALLRHGEAVFHHKVLFRSTSKKVLADREKYYINKYDSIENGYNSMHGGAIGTTIGKPVYYKGKLFSTHTKLADKLGLSVGAIMNRARRNLFDTHY